jgi:hypothetical protein
MINCFSKIVLLLICLIFISTTIIKAQDSLYLVGTITGESTQKNITYVKGIGDTNGDGYENFIISYSN